MNHYIGWSIHEVGHTSDSSISKVPSQARAVEVSINAGFEVGTNRETAKSMPADLAISVHLYRWLKGLDTEYRNSKLRFFHVIVLVVWLHRNVIH